MARNLLALQERVEESKSPIDKRKGNKLEPIAAITELTKPNNNLTVKNFSIPNLKRILMTLYASDTHNLELINKIKTEINTRKVTHHKNSSSEVKLDTNEGPYAAVE